jgi:hypothetical protein
VVTHECYIPIALGHSGLPAPTAFAHRTSPFVRRFRVLDRASARPPREATGNVSLDASTWRRQSPVPLLLLCPMLIYRYGAVGSVSGAGH